MKGSHIQNYKTNEQYENKSKKQITYITILAKNNKIEINLTK